MPVLRVVSYNIHKGRSATGGRESLADLRLGLYGLRPDLVFLQEVQGRNQVRGSLDAQHESLAAALHMQVAYGCNAVRQSTDHGNALLSRYPILYYENQDVSDHRLEQRGLLHCVVGVGDVPVHCLVVHLGLLAGGRSRQVQALVDRISRLVPAHEPLLIAGDFNDWSNRLAPLFVEQLGLVEVFAAAPRGPDEIYRLRRTVSRLRERLTWLPGQALRRAPELAMNGNARLTPPPRTFPSVFPWLRLDRIYQRGFAVRRARVLHGSPWKKLSDHAPLVAELELP
ncbi:endonuclease/exonuclease/phosphatase family protein [Castellaniella denitrificans]|jgi:endonuclease/exonuclease/phosphatase family metal-dependent hydrolase|uniref:Endonuclease/exonuclease/phosphatase family protein n=1 Tax=Castellaniella denitrificans TaxID=56119 RepID=A0ABT4M0K6_9BURK|nr:endonuclease/exonuclease/phosphatase family protein [Castellaniella denitrificans]MCZ4328851.1 endonuclease/exonuclease/phosphatase family protein [Castellaniella denitrificans]